MKNIKLNINFIEKLEKQIIEEKIKDERSVYKVSGNILKNEAEAMYFLAIRKFFENSISHRIMTHNQDIYENEFDKQNKRR